MILQLYCNLNIQQSTFGVYNMIRFDEKLWIFTPEEFKKLPPGTELTCISHKETKIAGTDDIDQDTRFGHIAWGVLEPLEEHPLSELFTVFALS